jgi:hypothetical protein
MGGWTLMPDAVAQFHHAHSANGGGAFKFDACDVRY